MTDSSKVELLIDVEMGDGRYSARYRAWNGEDYLTHVLATNMTREQLVARHVRVIQSLQPKTVAILSEGSEVGLHPGVVKMIAEGKLSDIELTLR
jgi:hypothetical protein